MMRPWKGLDDVGIPAVQKSDILRSLLHTAIPRSDQFVPIDISLVAELRNAETTQRFKMLHLRILDQD